MPRFLPELLRVIPLAEELNGPFRPKEPVTDRSASLAPSPCRRRYRVTSRDDSIAINTEPNTFISFI